MPLRKYNGPNLKTDLLIIGLITWLLNRLLGKV